MIVDGGEFTDSEIIVLMGENGTGKTIFIRLLAGNWNQMMKVSKCMHFLLLERYTNNLEFIFFCFELINFRLIHTEKKRTRKRKISKNKRKESKKKLQTSKKNFAVAFAFARCEWAFTPQMHLSHNEPLAEELPKNIIMYDILLYRN